MSSTRSEDVAGWLLRAASQDAAVLDKLLEDKEIGDAILGFHAQQAVEKALKAVLSHASVEFRRTHDLAELMDLMSDQGLPAPPHAEYLDELNPFAVAARYGPLDIGPLDRGRASEWVRDVLVWAQYRVSQHAKTPPSG